MGAAEEVIEARAVDSKDLQQQSKAFDKLTDHVEDRQLNSVRVQEAMASIASSAEADWNAMKMSLPSESPLESNSPGNEHGASSPTGCPKSTRYY